VHEQCEVSIHYQKKKKKKKKKKIFKCITDRKSRYSIFHLYMFSMSIIVYILIDTAVHSDNEMVIGWIIWQGSSERTIIDL
jgi:hypothetical protein